MGIVSWIASFFHLIAMVAAGAGAYGLIQLSDRLNLSKLKIAGYGLAAIAVTSVVGMMLNFIMTTFIAGMIGYSSMSFWYAARAIFGNGIDILGFAALAYGLFAANQEAGE
ncbi:MAG: hypothetical protein KC502_12500 [Myxococcales bacterium]|nr:hypothetical protein [Myxococcales bacterium]